MFTISRKLLSLWLRETGNVTELPSGFQALPDEIAIAIFEQSCHASPKTLLSVALTCSGFYHLSNALIYRDLSFHFIRSRRNINRTLIERLTQNARLARDVHKVSVLWAPNATSGHGQDGKRELELLEGLLPKLERLKAFIWDAQYPILPWLLDALHTHRPTCRLYTRYPPMKELRRSQIWQFPRQGDPPLTDIQNSQCLSSLDIHLHDATVLSRSGLKPIFLKIALSCRNLRDLSMNISASSGPVPHHIINTDGGRPLNLRSLAIIYHVMKLFDQSRWGSLTNWSALERLSLTGLSFLLEMSTQLDGLKDLSLDILIPVMSEKMELREFLLKTSNLEVLDVAGLVSLKPERGDDLYSHLGKTLKSLRLHQHQSVEDVSDLENDIVSSRFVLGPRDIDLLAKACPRLRSLGIDLVTRNRRNDGSVEGYGTLPYDVLAHLAQRFWFLEHLELDLGIDVCPMNKGVGNGSMAAVKDIWEYLRCKIRDFRAQQGHDITEPRALSLDVTVGDFTPYQGRDNQWDADQQQRIRANLSERDDEARRDVAHIACVELEALMAKLGHEGRGTDRQTLLIGLSRLEEKPRQDYIAMLMGVDASEMHHRYNIHQMAMITAVVDRACRGPAAHGRARVANDLELMRPPSVWDQREDGRFYH